MPRKNRPLIITADILLFFFAILFQITGIPDITIKTATPLLLVPMITAFSVYSSLPAAAVTGFVTGACLDGMASGTYCFNTIVLMLTGVAVYLTANNLFNKNVQSATALSLITAGIYFSLKWLVFYAFGVSVQDSMEYLLSFALPSALYTSLFIFPFYYLFRYFNKLLNS